MGQLRVKKEELELAQARVGIREDAVRWALEFAQMDLSHVLPGERFGKELEFWAFLRYATIQGGSIEGIVTLPTTLSLVEAQRLMLHIFRAAAAREPLETAIQETQRAVWNGTRYIPMREDNLLRVSTAEQLRCGLKRLIVELPDGYLVNACEAPQRRQSTLCGRLFLTNRSVQRYCSPVCQQRAHHRRNRRPRRHTAPA
jgi:hypothetical protein